MKRILCLIFFVCLIPARAFLEPSAPYEEYWRNKQFDYRAEDPGNDTLQQISVPKTAVMASITATTYLVAYLFVFKKGWWDEQGNSFHFENDFYYAKNIDKLGHFSSGVLMGEVFYEGYYWAGYSEFWSHVLAGASASLTHVAIDIKDGFSPKWGFSIFDVLAGSLGGFYPMAKRYVPFFKYIDLKWSYFINSNVYYENSDTGVFTDDYPNQTYWCSFKIYRMLPYGARAYYPEWLAFAVGVSIDDVIFHKGMGKNPRGGHYEIYLALDYDLEAFRPQQKWARNLVKALNYIKWPAPTIQVYPDVKLLLLYPIKF